MITTPPEVDASVLASPRPFATGDEPAVAEPCDCETGWLALCDDHAALIVELL